MDTPSHSSLETMQAETTLVDTEKLDQLSSNIARLASQQQYLQERNLRLQTENMDLQRRVKALGEEKTNMKRESNVEVSTQGINERAKEDITKGGNSMDPEMIKKISEKATGVKDYAMLLQHELKFLQIENRLLRNKNQELQEDRQYLEAENQLLKDDSWCLQKENQQLQKQVNTH